ncbi:exodeoxyribonuclease VII small subunit [Alysiella filiformis]|uniref:Exodeoxyribonuclease 7 small subunit n=1 Tax=Alysiella filiformis DSM 16848 TaxID=1120981 RepID=A0A286E5R7_9NEIS|nr:exodeoxyribonuclease VII small subunit [Alysiella filiformis]QMT30355.1 exodeoxyribonuclease VII small subunit [Alysiella filiformis]UBQ56668.1 exodeoxyribonuclease VII small subunit [Alysiella filiformis DSM 16848]SOD66211.1 Exodeoxyribonuclease VII small subunit [Alysiella filiformis DSM 16848]
MSRKSPKNFEDALNRLHNITQSMQYDELALEKSLAMYEEGVALLRFCHEKLNAVEQQLYVLENNELKELNLESHE